LQKLEVTWSEFSYPASSLKHSSLAEVSFHFGRNFFPSLDNHQSWIEDYVASGYRPQYVNIVYSNSPKWPIVSIKPLPILKWWSNHSTRDQYKPPDGYTAHFKLYGPYKVPLNLSPTLPELFIQFDSTPLVKVNRLTFWNNLGKQCNYHIFGQMYCSLKLHHCSCKDLSCKCIVVSASVNEKEISYDHTTLRSHRNGVVTMMDTMLDYVFVSVNDMNTSLGEHLEQLPFMVPNLQRLDLRHYDVSIDNMKGLYAVANNCRNLKGLNLSKTHMASLNVVVFWKILSGMKLTHLSIECCLLKLFGVINNQLEMVNLYSTLQAIEVGGGLCEVCKSSSSKDLLSLSNFSSLQYCTLLHHGACHSGCFQYITASCKKLKCITVEPNRSYQ